MAQQKPELDVFHVHNRTVEELERVAREWPTVLNERDPDFHTPRGQLVQGFIAPDFDAVLDGYPGHLTWAELKEVWRKELADYPAAWLEVKRVHAYVDDKSGTAKVYLDMDMNFMAGVDLKAYTELRWTMDKDGKWMCRGFHGMRGHSASAGFV